MRARRTRLGNLAGGLIAASVGAGVLAVGLRVGGGGAIVQIAPSLPDNALRNDVVIVLFVTDLAILVSPWI